MNFGTNGYIVVCDYSTLIYDETTGGQTLENIQHGSTVVSAAVDRKWKNGYRFTGAATVLNSGRIFDERAEAREARGKSPQICTVLIQLHDIATLRHV